MDLFAAILGAELESEAPDMEYVKEFDALWCRYYDGTTGWSE